MSYIAKRTEGREGAPLLLTFHGTGGDENQFHGFAEQVAPAAHVVSPRGDVSEMGHARYFRRTGEGIYDMADLARRTEAMGDFIEAEQERTRADSVFGFGYSNGANILAAVAFQRPDLLDAIALLHPLIPWTPDAQPQLKGTPVLITAGERDPICPPDQTRALAGYFEAQGAEVATIWHPGGHEIRQDEIDAVTAFIRDGTA